MAYLEYQGQKLELAEDWRVGELIEAENALKLSMDEAKGGGKLALISYITIRRTDTTTPAGALADSVLQMEIASLINDDEEAEAGPPAEGVEGGPDSETDEPQTFGPLRSASSA